MRILTSIALLFAFAIYASAQNIGIGTATPHPSALLDLESSDKGLLIPRLTQAEIDAMPSLTSGLLLFNTSSQCFQYHNGTEWIRLCADATPPCPPLPKATAGSNSPICVGEPLMLTAAPVEGATYYWTGPNGFESLSQNPTLTGTTMASAGDYYLTLWRLGCFGEPDTLAVTVTPPPFFRNCAQILADDASAPSGTYTIDPDGCQGPIAPFDCYCDMTTDGGGWTLVLNYLHQGGTNPVTQAPTTTLPILGSDVLGTNEATTIHWGHAAPALFNQIPKTELRFWARTGAHARVIHFKTSHANTLAYFNTGTGSMSGIQSSFTALAGHTANIPAASNAWFTSQGNAAMTEFPLYQTGAFHWGIRGLGSRWEVDDWPNNATQNTHHQIWIR